MAFGTCSSELTITYGDNINQPDIPSTGNGSVRRFKIESTKHKWVTPLQTNAMPFQGKGVACQLGLLKSNNVP